MAFVPAPAAALAAAPARAPAAAAASAFVAPAVAAATAPRRSRLPAVGAGRVLAGGAVRMEVAVGAPAPPFTLPTDGGGELSLAGLAGKKVVLYFCTAGG